jgi:uncharacterized repeat protein (TIGR01451 family)
MPEDPLIGRQLANFRIERLIKRGGMARVYYGQDVKLERPVAIKVIDFQYRDNPTYAERFVREARAVATWRHENIVQVYYADDQAGLYYFCMEYIDGLDLGELLASCAQAGERMPHEEVLRIGRAIASALDYAHGEGVIHRDIKPSNVMVAKDDRVVLTDFGLALDVHRGSLGEAFGSAHYIAPEQAQSSANAVPQSDLYSLGVILYQMLTGVVPFDDPSPTSVALQHLTVPPPSPCRNNPDLGKEVEAVLLKALSKAPGDRYQSGAELMNALEQALVACHSALGEQDTAVPTTPDVVPAFADVLQLHAEDTTVGQVAELPPGQVDAFAPPPPPVLDAPPVVEPAPAGRRVPWMLYVLLVLGGIALAVIAGLGVLYATNENARQLVSMIMSREVTVPVSPAPFESKVEPPVLDSPLITPTVDAPPGVTVVVTATQTPQPTPPVPPTATPTATPVSTPTPAAAERPQLEVSVSALPETVGKNQEMVFTIRIVVQNRPALGVVLSDTIPAHTEYVEGSVTQGGRLVGNSIRWEVARMKVGEEYVYEYSAIALTGGRIVNEIDGLQCDDCVVVLQSAVAMVVVRSNEIYMPLIFRNAQ